METNAMFVYSCLCLILVSLPFQIDSTVQHCKYTSILIVNEEGQEQILTVKDPESDSSCGCQPPQQGTIDSQCQLPAEGPDPSSNPAIPPAKKTKTDHSRKLFQSTGPDGMPYPAHRISRPPFQPGALYWALVPVVTISAGDIMSSLCDNRITLDDLPDICDVFYEIVTDCPERPIEGCGNKQRLDMCTSFLVEHHWLQVPTGVEDVDQQIAYGHVMLGAGMVDEAAEYFTSIIKGYPNLAAAYHGRGMSYIKKGFVNKLAERALGDFTKASDLEPENPEHYQRMAELYLPLKKYSDAVRCVARAVELSEEPTSRILFLKATLELAVQNLKVAETDYRQSLELGEFPHTDQAYYNLGLTLYYRGMLRNSIETFKELIARRPDHIDAHCAMAHAYSQLGDIVNARRVFNSTLNLDKDHLLAHQLKGTFHYNYGDMPMAIEEFQTCLQLDPSNFQCQYMESLAYHSQGQFYKAIKGFTKVIVNQKPTIKISPELIKAQYLREYSRFLHHNLDENLQETDVDSSFTNEYKHKWLMGEPFNFKSGYSEQPGLSPSTSDIELEDFPDLPLRNQELICLARNVGGMMTHTADGVIYNSRMQLTMGLAALHVAEAMRDVWHDVGASKTDLTMTWRKMFDISVKYIRLINPEEPMFWLDKMDIEDTDTGYNHDSYIIKGHTLNPRMMHYFDLVYRLVRTMISVHCGEGEMYPEEMMYLLSNIENHEELIDCFKKEIFRDQGFVMMTQLSSMKNPTSPKNEGVMLSVSSNKVGRMTLSVNMPYNQHKAHVVYQEMDYIFFELYHEIKKLGGKSSEDPDHIINLVLSLVYYFLNLSPVSHGSSAVAWSVAVGLIMSVGREVSGKIPPGKLMDLEAALTGGPELFSGVTKNWMKIKRAKDNPLDTHQSVSEIFPTIRDVLEAISYTHIDCYRVMMETMNF